MPACKRPMNAQEIVTETILQMLDEDADTRQGTHGQLTTHVVDMFLEGSPRELATFLLHDNAWADETADLLMAALSLLDMRAVRSTLAARVIRGAALLKEEEMKKAYLAEQGRE